MNAHHFVREFHVDSQCAAVERRATRGASERTVAPRRDACRLTDIDNSAAGRSRCAALNRSVGDVTTAVISDTGRGRVRCERATSCAHAHACLTVSGAHRCWRRRRHVRRRRSHRCWRRKVGAWRGRHILWRRSRSSRRRKVGAWRRRHILWRRFRCRRRRKVGAWGRRHILWRRFGRRRCWEVGAWGRRHVLWCRAHTATTFTTFNVRRTGTQATARRA